MSEKRNQINCPSKVAILRGSDLIVQGIIALAEPSVSVCLSVSV